MPNKVTSDIHFRNVVREGVEAVLKEMGLQPPQPWNDGHAHPAPGTMMVEVPGEPETAENDRLEEEKPEKAELFTEADEEMASNDCDDAPGLLQYAQAILPRGYPFPGAYCPVCGSDNVDIGPSQDAPDSWASVKKSALGKVVIGHSVPLHCNHCGASGLLTLDAYWQEAD